MESQGFVLRVLVSIGYYCRWLGNIGLYEDACWSWGRVVVQVYDGFDFFRRFYSYVLGRTLPGHNVPVIDRVNGSEPTATILQDFHFLSSNGVVEDGDILQLFPIFVMCSYFD